MLKLYKLIWNKSTLSNLNLELETWLEVLRRHDFSKILEIPSNLIENSIWEEAAEEMRNLTFCKTPSETLNSIVKSITMISRAYSLLSETGDDVTADDILQLVSYVILRSSVSQLYTHILYVKALNYEPESEQSGIKTYCIRSLEIAL